MSKKTTKTDHVMSILTKSLSGQAETEEETNPVQDSLAQDILQQQETQDKLSNAVENSLKELFEQENSHLFTPPVAPAPVSTSAPVPPPPAEPLHTIHSPQAKTAKQADADARSHKIAPMHGVISAKDLPRGVPVYTYKPMKDDYMVVPEISDKPSFPPPPPTADNVEYKSDTAFPARF
ncbi:MAG: hypothetical protein RR162_07115, partial [Oscillospiraceae bacterium]